MTPDPTAPLLWLCVFGAVLLTAILGAWAGAARGRAAAGAILGLLLGPLGVLAALMLPANPPRVRTRRRRR